MRYSLLQILRKRSGGEQRKTAGDLYLVCHGAVCYRGGDHGTVGAATRQCRRPRDWRTERPEHFIITDGKLTGISTAGKAIADACDELHVTIPDGVTNISIPESNTLYDGPFYNYRTKLTSVILPDGLEEIGIGAFFLLYRIIQY